MFHIYVDGSCLGNQNVSLDTPAGWGVVVITGSNDLGRGNGEILHEFSGKVVTKSALTNKSTKVLCTPVPWALVGMSSLGPALALIGTLQAINRAANKITAVFLIIYRKKWFGYNRVFFTEVI